MALVCSNPEVVQNCDLCAQITLAPPVELNSGILITVTATLNNVCVGNTLSIGAILCERFPSLDAKCPFVCRTIATKVIEEFITGDSCCTSITRDFTFLVKDECIAPDCSDRTFIAAVEAHYVLDCDCPCDCPAPVVAPEPIIAEE